MGQTGCDDDWAERGFREEGGVKYQSGHVCPREVTIAAAARVEGRTQRRGKRHSAGLCAVGEWKWPMAEAADALRVGRS